MRQRVVHRDAIALASHCCRLPGPDIESRSGQSAASGAAPRAAATVPGSAACASDAPARQDKQREGDHPGGQESVAEKSDPIAAPTIAPPA
jgi:hypothetical protein